MACMRCSINRICINIPNFEEISNITYYNIHIKVAETRWVVPHRYSEFYDLNTELVTEHGVSKDLLPSKKVIRNKCPIFIETRRKGLEEYLTKVFTYLERTMPRIFLEFLDFHIYDVQYILEDLSNKFFNEAEFILNSTKSYTFTPLELYAVHESCKKYECMENHINANIGPILDFCSQITSVNITGMDQTYKKSNIILNKLPFDLSMFKVLKDMSLKNISLKMIRSLGNIRKTLEKLTVRYANMKEICEILQCDVLHKLHIHEDQYWTKLEYLDLCKNNTVVIDQTINLVPNLKTLILNDNKISLFFNLSTLSSLRQLSICNNLISVCSELHVKLGNISILNLSQNKIDTLAGFSKLYSLETLDLSINKVSNVEEILHLNQLPCLKNLILNGNVVASVVDYRIKVLQYFGERCNDICLDNEKPSQSELDKVSVLRAIRIVKEGKAPI